MSPEPQHFYLPVSWGILRWMPQPRWLRRWYYRKSVEWWGHPNRHHWKRRGNRVRRNLRPGERDLWSGIYRKER